jgi:intein/homing endonuclease
MEKDLSTAATDCPDFERREVLNKNYYFDNERVERLMYEYLAGACIDVRLRDEIMEHASELIRQLIKAHNLNQICPGKDGAVNGDLFQTAWLQIESSLYKYEARPHCAVCYNSLRPSDSLLVDGFLFIDEVIKRIKKCPKCKAKLIKDNIYYRGKSKVFNFWCINPNSLLLTTNGIRSIGSIDGGGVFGLDGMSNVVNKFNKPKLDTLIITTELGYSIEGTPLHRLYRLNNGCPEWVMMKDLREGDLLAIQYNQQYFVGDDDLSDIVLEESGEWNPPSEITGELAYLFGLYLFGFDIKLVKKDGKYVKEIEELKVTFEFAQGTEFIRKIGFNETQLRIPDRLLRMSKDNIIALLKGISRSDDLVSIDFSSSSIILLNQVRLLLLNLGILTKLTGNRIESEIQNTPDGPVVKWLPIKSIVKSQSEVCDIEVDSESHSYIANGFVSHNSQVGRTVVLAYIKKENRDHKNCNMFQTHLENKTVKKSEMLDRFTEEAKNIFKYNDDYNKILDAINRLYCEDDKPHDGLISKLVTKTNLSRSTITEFLRTLRLRSKDFTDSPVNEENENLKARIQVDFEEFD